MNTLKRILNYTKNYWRYLLISIITASFYGIFSAAPTYILKHAVDDIFIKKINNLYYFFKKFIENFSFLSLTI
jgi:ABC-type multidrug transport system fused ATPase/permease subunit